jgi:1-aminocyclopropane-1-carboxylate deaminase/D-cysteine desulfhydrase-like pyridoxal-dependent ACC family enzyme
MAALIEHVRTGKIPPESNIAFLHTGGIPALFAQYQNLGIEGLLDR